MSSFRDFYLAWEGVGRVSRIIPVAVKVTISDEITTDMLKY